MTPAVEQYVLHWGEMGTRWGVNRTVAQIHALLYLSPEPLHAEAIAETLGVALLTALTYGMDTDLAMVCLLAIYVGGTYGGSPVGCVDLDRVVDPIPNLVAWWPLDETVGDTSEVAGL